MKVLNVLKQFTAALVVAMFALSSHAAPIRVSQETSAGAGDFDSNILGFIDPIAYAGTVSAFYAYGAASYNGDTVNGGPTAVSNESMIFFVSATDGLHLVQVHDRPNDGSGGTADTTYYMAAGPGFTLEDDPGELSQILSGGTEFDVHRGWIDCCTDGVAIGDVTGLGAIYAEFDSWSGITAFNAVDDSTAISLVLAADQRVRFDVPGPASVLIFGVGLAAVALRRRRA